MFLKYRGIILSSMLNVANVTMDILPQRENFSINIPSRAGAIYNGFRYGIREINIECYVDVETSDERVQNCKDIKDAMSSPVPARLYIDDEYRYYYATPDYIDIEEINDRVSKLDLKFTCFDPFIYNEENLSVTGNKNLTVINSGTHDTQPIINVSLNSKAHFVQIANMNTGDNFLIGKYPFVGKPPVSSSSSILDDNCTSITPWTSSGNILDAGRDIGSGSGIVVNSGGYGITSNSFGSTGTGTWHGPCRYRNLSRSVTDFEVSATIEFDSKGLNKSNSTNTPSTPEGGGGTSGANMYVTTAPLFVRSGPAVTNAIVTGMPINHQVQVYEVRNGWGRLTYKGISGWSNMQYLKLISTPSANNYKTNGMLNVRSGRGTSYQIVTTMPNNTTVAVTDIQSNWGKVTYNGKAGYANVSYMTKLDDLIPVVETVADETADDKVGLMEIYGFSNDKKLFKFSMYDSNQYYEHTIPEIQIGNNVVLTDATAAPTPNQKIEYDSDGKEKSRENDLSGKFGNWNEFFGVFNIRRNTSDGKQRWYAEINKIENGITVRHIRTNELNNGSYPTEALNKIVIYYGQNASLGTPAMVLTNLKVKTLNDINYEEKNELIFNKNDELDIDFATGKVYKNGELYMKEVDVGSKFFSLGTGHTNIKVLCGKENSSDSDPDVMISFKERSL